MNLVKCSKCGEMYSGSYRRCPFCEEEESFHKPKPSRGSAPRRGGSRAARRRGSPATLIVVLVLLLALALLTWYFFFSDGKLPSFPTPSGDITEVQPDTPDAPDEIVSDVPDVTEPTPPDVAPDIPDVVAPPTDEPTPPEKTDPVTPDVPVVPSVVDTGAEEDVPGAALNKTDFTLKVGDSYALRVSGTSVSPVWNSDNAEIVTVDESGRVTALAVGKATVTATVGSRTLKCIVRVKSAPSTGTTVDLSSVALDRDDFTIPVGGSYKLKLSGTSESAAWSSADSSIATVDDGGKVVGVAKGRTKVTAQIGGKTLSCIVRVSG